MPESHRTNWRLTGTPAVVVTSCAMGVAVLGSTIPSGLYTRYERLWSLPVSSTTHVFAMYILGVLVALIGLGHLADHVGRLPVMIGALVLSLASSACFLLAHDAHALYLGRFLSGLSVGVCTGAYTAALREHCSRPATGALLSTTITSASLAAGPIFSGLTAHYSDHPLRTPYAAYVIGTLICLVAVATVAEPGSGGTTTGWLRIRFGVPRQVMPTFAAAALALSCAYAANGLFQSIVPLYARSFFHRSDLLAAAYVTLMLGTSAGSQLLASRIPTRFCIRAGLLFLATGFTLVAVSVFASHQWLLAAATIIVGIGNGLAFRGSLTRIAHAAPLDREAQVVSSYYAVGYLSTAVPPLLAGVGAARVGLPLTFALLVLVLAAAAIVNTFAPDLRQPAR